ncbi:arabinan endo-1,5-alpha-L-arabinosidase [Fulvivirga sediminis]|uniref:Arabinan endo-1,5-alpha-L-arabinosidase n=1 Tax=Fulvivirga sediminis TaxID=2803949 RepID=A0A937F6U3_9BACT|nr:arabinan endo-1,5-alpha-L-arabinosidase [Fulvivirga sediminis]MBL3656092.1 arabinan endo-1,5-alpha-L-arabinosidase [Fulvivirga sediminis]
MKRTIILLSFILLLPLLGCTQSSDIIVHDPVVAQEGGKYYLFCTGWSIAVYSSENMKDWKKEASVFAEPPSWALETVKEFKGHIWAPDISYHNGWYYLYYSVSAFAKNTSAIGVAVNKSLNPSDKDFKWVDKGMVVQSVPNRDFWNAIDPNLVEDDEGNPWMSFGSFWGGLKLVRLNNDRTSLAEPQEWYTIAARKRTDFLDDSAPGDAAIEAPFIFKKNGYYYLFASWDYCCRGAESTYKMVVGRSQKVTGPYLDKEGKDMAKGGGTILLRGNKKWPGVGHNSTYTFDGKDYLVFHGYDMNDDGKPKLKITKINWDKDFWPMVDQSVLSK